MVTKLVIRQYPSYNYGSDPFRSQEPEGNLIYRRRTTRSPANIFANWGSCWAYALAIALLCAIALIVCLVFILGGSFNASNASNNTTTTTTTLSPTGTGAIVTGSVAGPATSGAGTQGPSGTQGPQGLTNRPGTQSPVTQGNQGSSQAPTGPAASPGPAGPSTAAQPGQSTGPGQSVPPAQSTVAPPSQTSGTRQSVPPGQSTAAPPSAGPTTGGSPGPSTVRPTGPVTSPANIQQTTGPAASVPPVSGPTSAGVPSSGAVTQSTVRATSGTSMQTTTAFTGSTPAIPTCPTAPVLIHRRVDSSGFFEKTWSEMKVEQGSPGGNYWKGLEAIHQMTMTNSFLLSVKVTTTLDVVHTANYSIQVGEESGGYVLTISDFVGSITFFDAFDGYSGYKFSTKDRKNDQAPANTNCATELKGAWWYGDCACQACLTQTDTFIWRLGFTDYTLKEANMTLICK